MKKLLFLFSILVFTVSLSAQSFKYHPTASATLNGYLSSTDWTTFNNKFTLPSLTSGSVMFSNGTTLAQDNANLFWDDTNNRLGIGTPAPTTELHVVSTSGSDPRGFMSSQYSSDALAAMMHFRKSRGTFGLPTTILVGDMLGRSRYSGYDGTAFLQMASIDVGTSGTIGTGRIPTYMTFSTATNAATSVLTERMRIDSEGSISLPSSGLNASLPMLTMTGTWYASGTATTTKPHFLIEPAGAASTNWDLVGTAIGVNAATGYLGKLLDLQKTAVSMFSVNYRGDVKVGRSITFGQAGSASLMYSLTTANGTPDNSGTNIQIGINTTTQRATAGGYSVYGAGVYAHTSGNQYFNLITSSFGAGAGSASYRPLGLLYTINNSGVQSGTATGIFLNATETALNSMTHNLMDLQVGGVSQFKVSNTGVVVANNVVRLKGYTVATLPAGTVGDTAYVTDALTPAYLVTVVGGGAVTTAVFYNGTNWVAH